MVHHHALLMLAALVGTPQTPDGMAGVMRLHGEGVQSYDCRKSPAGYGWAERQPEALLTDADGHIRAHQGTGPIWTAADGSEVAGQAIATIPAPRRDAIPWLVLRAVSPNGEHILDGVTYVLRTETVGGVAPAEGCDQDHDGAVANVPYEATYTFLRPGDPPIEP
jgi:hypothetical protein